MQSDERHLLHYAKPSNSAPSPTMVHSHPFLETQLRDGWKISGREDPRLEQTPSYTTLPSVQEAAPGPQSCAQQVVVTPLGHSERRSAYIPLNTINSVSLPNVRKKRHPLGDPKLLSPSLRRSQTRAGDSLSIQETSSTERVATGPKCPIDRSLRGIPATITSEVADTGIGSGVEENREQPRVPPPQGATATSADRGAQADREEFRAAFPKDAKKSTSKSEPRLDPEPHPTAVSDGKDINAVVTESMALIPCPPSLNFGAVDGKFFDNDPKDSDEIRTQSRKDLEVADPHDVSFRSRSMMRDSPTPVIVKEPQYIVCAAPNRPVVVANVPTLGHSPHASVYVLLNAINSGSPLTVSEKRHPLGDPRPLSPTLPPGRSQTRAGDSLSVQESSSTERVATGPRRSFDGSLRGTPATITSEVADTGIGSAVEENREQREVLPPQSATATSTDRCAQADREEFRATSQKNAEKSTKKSEPKLDPEPLPMVASDGKEVDVVEAESDSIDPISPLPNIGAVNGIKFLILALKGLMNYGYARLKST
ncbi:hypothetical protein EDD15DRAFT_2441766 [Pisolithus albus]|nr:hypothetical protein EDD15DRAFT_2441766 [Pisolithus albus]